MAAGRSSYTATLLPQGQVLVAGGFGDHFLPSAELYDPTTGLWTATGSMVEKRSGHTATLLSNGQVLVAGGQIDFGVPTASAELYDSVAGPPITLGGTRRKVGGINTVRLKWREATSTDIDVYRDGTLIVTTPNDGSYIDSTGDTGRARYTYQVCEAGTQTCSNEATVTFPQ